MTTTTLAPPVKPEVRHDEVTTETIEPEPNFDYEPLPMKDPKEVEGLFKFENYIYVYRRIFLVLCIRQGKKMV